MNSVARREAKRRREGLDMNTVALGRREGWDMNTVALGRREGWDMNTPGICPSFYGAACILALALRYVEN